MQCIDFSGRVFGPRRDVRSMECKHGLPMAENESPCTNNHPTIMIPLFGWCFTLLLPIARSFLLFLAFLPLQSLRPFGAPPFTQGRLLYHSGSLGAEMSPCPGDCKTTMTPAARSGVFCGGALDEGTRRADQKRQQCCLFLPRVLRHRPPHAVRSTSTACRWPKTITPAGVFRSTPAAQRQGFSYPSRSIDTPLRQGYTIFVTF